MNIHGMTCRMFNKPCVSFPSMLALVCAVMFVLQSGCAASSNPPETGGAVLRGDGLLLDLDEVSDVRARSLQEPVLASAREGLLAEAETAMGTPVRPVTYGKDAGKPIAPSGDPRDYVSLSPYWWPNPDVPSGEPYVRRDGEVNPERFDYDTPKLGDFGQAVRLLAFAYAMTGDEKYAERALEHVRAWFVTPETRMNPSMRFAQFIPGVSLGRRVGIIDTNRLR